MCSAYRLSTSVRPAGRSSFVHRACSSPYALQPLQLCWAHFPLAQRAQLWHSPQHMLKLVQLVLQTLVPLLERRTLAVERQATAAERLEDVVRTYLCYTDPEFRALLLGEVPLSDTSPVDVEADHGTERDLKSARIEELRVLWYTEHGELLDDERVIEEYDRLYSVAEDRLDADRMGEGVAGG